MRGFHGNPIVQRLVNTLIGRAGVTSFVETGTHYAFTAVYMAHSHPTLPVFTCEIDDRCHAASLAALRPYQNASLSKESSEKFIDRLIAENALGGLPMFFLDAHWFDYWPLVDEIAAIGKLPRFIAMVDDFMVPGQSQFGYDVGGGGTVGLHRTKRDDRPCDMSLIGSLLPVDCQVGYPNYGVADVPEASHLRGHVVIAHGVGDMLAFSGNDAHYFWGGIR